MSVTHPAFCDLDIDHAISGTGEVRHERLAPIWFAAG
jgi:hypothetical protein